MLPMYLLLFPMVSLACASLLPFGSHNLLRRFLVDGLSKNRLDPNSQTLLSSRCQDLPASSRMASDLTIPQSNCLAMNMLAYL